MSTKKAKRYGVRRFAQYRDDRQCFELFEIETGKCASFPGTKRDLEKLARERNEPPPAITPEVQALIDAARKLAAYVDSVRWGSQWPGRPHLECDELRTALSAFPESSPKALTPEEDPRDKALKAFISTIENTGGVGPADCDGGEVMLAPVDDPEWVDLGDAYLAACNAIGKAPMIYPAHVE